MRISDWSSEVCSSDLVIDVLGVAKLNWTLVIDESYVLDGRTIPKLININCYAIDMDLQSGLTKGRRVKVSGRYTERGRERVTREMQEIGRASCRERGCQYV